MEVGRGFDCEVERLVGVGETCGGRVIDVLRVISQDIGDTVRRGALEDGAIDVFVPCVQF